MRGQNLFKWNPEPFTELVEERMNYEYITLDCFGKEVEELVYIGTLFSTDEEREAFEDIYNAIMSGCDKVIKNDIGGDLDYFFVLYQDMRVMLISDQEFGEQYIIFRIEDEQNLNNF